MSATSIVASQARPVRRKTGLALWMDRVLEECDRASVDFATDPVHDLRVALRRCRSLADGLKSLDPRPEWKAMKRAGKAVFQSLGELRDVQVMEEWVAQLGEMSDPASVKMLHYLTNRQHELKVHAATALRDFDRKQWKRWGTILPRHAQKLRPGNLVFKHLALERWTEAYELHRRALRNGSKLALHNLRIGIKRFRYIVENFLPEQHAAWKDDLKDMQDVLGEIHDLDVFWATALQTGAFHDAESRTRWHAKIMEERRKRIEKYRAKMLGPKSLWHLWRVALPSGPQAEAAALRRMKLWASFVDPDVRHSTNVARLALQLFDQLPDGRKDKSVEEKNAHTLREILEVAGILHNVGRRKHVGKEKVKLHKPTRLIRKLNPPLGWSAADMQFVAAVVRHQRVVLPRGEQKYLTGLTAMQRREAMRLGGILRLASAFDVEHDGRIRRLRVLQEREVFVIEAEGYMPRDSTAQSVAAARYLLETIYRRAILVKPMRVPKPRKAPILRAA